MPDLTIDNTAKSLPASEGQATKIAEYNAIFNALQAAWTLWTPTLASIAIGTGGSALNSGKFRQIGKLVVCRLVIGLGSSGASVSGDLSFTLPVARIAFSGVAGIMTIGRGSAYDLSADTPYEGLVTTPTTTTAKLRFPIASGTYITRSASSIPSSTIPFTWGAGDEIHAEFMYEAG